MAWAAEPGRAVEMKAGGGTMTTSRAGGPRARGQGRSTGKDYKSKTGGRGRVDSVLHSLKQNTNTYNTQIINSKSDLDLDNG